MSEGEDTYEMQHNGDKWTFDVVAIDEEEDVYSVQIQRNGVPVPSSLDNAGEKELIAWAEDQGEDFYDDFITHILPQIL